MAILLFIVVSMIVRTLGTPGFVHFHRSISPPVSDELYLRMSDSNDYDVIESGISRANNREIYGSIQQKSKSERKALRWVIESIYNQLNDERGGRLLNTSDIVQGSYTDPLPNRLLSTLRLLYAGKFPAAQFLMLILNNFLSHLTLL